MSGVRVDINERPELQRGQVEFVAGSEYCTRPPPFPTYLFVIGRSYHQEFIDRCELSERGIRYVADHLHSDPRFDR